MTVSGVQRSPGVPSLWPGGRTLSENEIRCLWAEQLIDKDCKIRLFVAVHIAVDVGIAAFIGETQFAGRPAKDFRPDEAERLIAGFTKDRVDGGKVDLVLLELVEVEDSVEFADIHGAIATRLERESVPPPAAVKLVRALAAIERVIAHMAIKHIIARAAP